MLADAITDFAVSSLQKQIGWGIDTDICYCLGTGKNYRFLSHLNDKHKFFLRIEPLEHPRYIMQYKLKEKDFYIADYIRKLRQDV
jgi:hypothetical protein